ncbi:hydroxysqualene dehydroxylase HpnE [Niveibacterium umoris]|uniref:Squalene-associated FAD-dependent desaturase n=1 Tax=Niveibacterium umoris TaxID=1193620 RepID=A0A840BL14_9RHOO|nr:hydroxysqualene dehydroxylase HpnE [Niveibacterium umoris]MBB4011207.1 squalene-associated FAD-dependent desaturase [Niveibacterium umoris]
MSPHVAVIGAGWSGLACAVELARADIRVTVFEGASTLGGRARVVEKDGWRVDNGQHILVGAYTETLRMLRMLKVSPKKLYSAPFFVHVPGKLDLQAAALPAPLHLAVGLLRAKGLNWADRRAAVRLLNLLKRTKFKLAEDITVSALLMRAQQTETLRRLVWEPLCIAALNTPAERASAQIFANVLRDSVAASASASEVLIPKVDLTELLPVPAVLFLSRNGQSVHTMTKIRGIARADDSFALEGDPFDGRYSHVVLATAPWQVPALTAEFSEMERLREQLAAMQHEAITTVYLSYDPPLRLARPMIGLDGGFLQWLFDRGQLGGPAGMLAGVISAADTELSREEIALRAHQDVERLMVPDSGHLPSPKWAQVITEKRATFACEPGAFRPITITPVKNLLLAGDYVASDYPATLEGAVRSGLQAARTVFRSLGVAPPKLFTFD